MTSSKVPTAEELVLATEEAITRLDRSVIREAAMIRNALAGLPHGVSETMKLAQDWAHLRQSAVIAKDLAPALGVASIVNSWLPHVSVVQSMHQVSVAASFAQTMMGNNSLCFTAEYSNVIRTLSSLQRLDLGLSKLLPRQDYLQWSNHWESVVGATAKILAIEWGRPMGVLTAIDSAEGSSLTWVNPAQRKKLSVAALLRQDSLPSEFVIDVVVTCEFCGKTMTTGGQEFSWTGERKGRLDITVLPICIECSRLSIENDGYLERAFLRFKGPKLRLIEDGKSDGIPKGRLHLVQDEDSQHTEPRQSD